MLHMNMHLCCLASHRTTLFCCCCTCTQLSCSVRQCPSRSMAMAAMNLANNNTKTLPTPDMQLPSAQDIYGTYNDTKLLWYLGSEYEVQICSSPPQGSTHMCNGVAAVGCPIGVLTLHVAINCLQLALPCSSHRAAAQSNGILDRESPLQ